MHRLICQHAGAPQVQAGATLVQELMTYDIPSTLTVNNYFGVLQAVLSHLGIGRAARLSDRGFHQPDPGAARDRIERGAGVPGLSRRNCGSRSGLTAFRDFVTEEVIAHRKRLKDEVVG